MTSSSDSEPLVIPVMAESLEVSSVREHVGTVRVRKLVSVEPQEVSEEGFREWTEVVRVEVGRPVQSAEAPSHRGETLVIPVYEERLIKQLFLAEEVHLIRRREALKNDQVIELRKEKLIVERFDPQTGLWVADPS